MKNSGYRGKGTGDRKFLGFFPAPCSLQPAPRARGFTLLIAVVLASVAAAVTLALTTLAYKSLVLSSAAKESQFAFYAADAALECLMYYDSSNAPGGLGNPKFPLTSTPGDPTIDCAESDAVEFLGSRTGSGASLETKYASDWFSIHGNRCAKLTIYKTPTSIRGYAEGSNTACTDLDNPRGIVRAIRAIY